MTRDDRTAHAADEVLREYARGGLSPVLQQRLEPHLDVCAHCADRLASAVDPAVLDRIWNRVDEAIDVPVPGRLERLLLRLRVPDRVARLMAATPALRGSWLGGAVLTLLFTALVARLADAADAHLVLLAVAPLLPVAGVAVSFGRRWDPVYEVGLVAPMSALRLVLIRSTVVLGTSLVLSTATACALPRVGLVAFAWLLPSCTLTVLSIALSARLGHVTAACVVVAGWLVLLTLTRHADIVASALGQTAVAGLFLTAVALISVLRASFDTENPTQRR
ncbi:hypothetical protein [Streptomyces sp. G45]|uniref:hypothetical protein n=1 Tax=Streptomyces sp. G45 TaxID=3406627 RepID=UPI003C1BCB28